MAQGSERSSLSDAVKSSKERRSDGAGGSKGGSQKASASTWRLVGMGASLAVLAGLGWWFNRESTPHLTAQEIEEMKVPADAPKPGDPPTMPPDAKPGDPPPVPS